VPSLPGLIGFCTGSRHFRAGLQIVPSLRDWRGNAMQLGFAMGALLGIDPRSNPRILELCHTLLWS
jgi:hypothetical protein